MTKRLHIVIAIALIALVSAVAYAGERDQKIAVVRKPFPVRLLQRLAFRVGIKRVEDLPLRRYSPPEDALFAADWLPDGARRTLANLAPDVVNLHFVSGFLRIETLPRLGRPIVWTLCDSWPFTGGCFLPRDCEGYRER